MDRREKNKLGHLINIFNLEGVFDRLWNGLRVVEMFLQFDLKFKEKNRRFQFIELSLKANVKLCLITLSKAIFYSRLC